MPTPMQAAIMSSGAPAAYVDMWFAANTYRVAGVTTGDLPLVSGFTFTGASLRTMFDSTGAMTYGPNNQLTYSEQFDNAAWTKAGSTATADQSVAPNGTLTMDRITDTTENSPHYVRQWTTMAGGSMIFSAHMRAVVGQRYVSLTLYDSSYKGCVFDLLTGTVSFSSGAVGAITDIGAGIYRCSILVNVAAGTVYRDIYMCNGSGSLTPSYVGTGANTFDVWGAQIEAVTYQTTPAAYMPTTSAAYYGPRLVYDPVTLASLGIMVEEARTNLCLQSQDFDNASWTKSNSTITANAVTSPDGTATADAIVDDATNAEHWVRQSISVTSGTVYTLSVYAKANTLNYVWLYAGTPNVGTYFNLATGAVLGNIGGAPTSSTITAVGNGWYRCAITYTAGATSAQNQYIGVSQNGTTLNYVGTGQGVYLWQAQFEAGTGASSPIPTTSASVTRAADAVSLTGIAPSSAFSLVSEANAGVVGESFRVATCSDGTTNNRFGNFLTNTTALRCIATVAASGVTIESGARTVGVPFKQASRFDGVSTFATSGNGAAVVSGTNAITPAALTQLNIGGLPGLPEAVGTTISRIRIYNRALTDAQLQALTA